MSGKFLPDEYLSGRVSIPDGEEAVHVLIYARVSHQDSALSDLSIPEQIAACREECARRDWLVAGIYQDAGRSAYSDSDDREGFQELIRAALDSQGTDEPVSRIVVDKLDRFSRDEDVNITYKRRLLPQNGVQVFSVAERFDGTAGPGRTMERITEAMAIGRSEEIGRDTMRALVQNASSGHSCGGKPPWGYKAVKTPIGTDSRGNPKTRTDWHPDAKARPDVTRLFGLLADGLPIQRVAKVMNEEGRPAPKGDAWSKVTVYDLARRVYVYEGTYVWNMGHIVEWRDEDGRKRKTHRLKDPRTWVRTENAYEPLIDPRVAQMVRARFPLQVDSAEMYERQARRLVDDQRADRKLGGHTTPADGISNRARGSDWLLTTTAVCASCGSGLVSYTHNRKRKDGSTWKAYRCGGYHRSGGSTCRSFYVPAERLETAVFEGVTSRLADRFAGKDTKSHIRKVVARVRRQAAQRVKSLAIEAAKREEQMLRIVDLGVSGGLDTSACNVRIQSLRAEAAEMRDKQRALEVLTANLDAAAVQAEACLRSADDLMLMWELLNPQEKRERLRQLVSVIVVHVGDPGGDPNHAVIHFRGLLGDQEAHRRALKAQIAEKPTAPEHQRPQAIEALGADVNQYIGSARRTRIRTCAIIDAWGDLDSRRNAAEFVLHHGKPPAVAPEVSESPVPCPRETTEQRAVRFQQMLASGEVRTRADLAHRLGVARSYVTQVLRHLPAAALEAPI